jgi:hypothetical protein
MLCCPEKIGSTLFLRVVSYDIFSYVGLCKQALNRPWASGVFTGAFFYIFRWKPWYYLGTTHWKQCRGCPRISLAYMSIFKTTYLIHAYIYFKLHTYLIHAYIFLTTTLHIPRRESISRPYIRLGLIKMQIKILFFNGSTAICWTPVRQTFFHRTTVCQTFSTSNDSSLNPSLSNYFFVELFFLSNYFFVELFFLSNYFFVKLFFCQMKSDFAFLQL